MTSKKCNIIIIGAGLSGLTTAYELQKHGVEDYILLEGRDRIGGRILTKDDIDLGATWFQSHHQDLMSLLRELDIGVFHQYSEGKSVFVYSSMAPPQYFESDPDLPGAYRIKGGSSALIHRLSSFSTQHIRLSHQVLSVYHDQAELTVVTNQGTYNCQKIVMALPPQLMANITFEPKAPKVLTQAMKDTHTWMSNAIKVGIKYREPFWRHNHLSGTLIGHVSPVIELYDHTSEEGEAYSLMGFVNEGLRSESPTIRKERILTYVEKHLGLQAQNYISYIEKDWSLDPLTSSDQLRSVYISPRYDLPIFEEDYFNQKIILAGAETSTLHGGYMDGAVISGRRAAARCLS